MVGWHHRLDGHEFEQAVGVGDGQGSLVCSSDLPTGNLDSRASHIVMEELKAIHEEGNTIIMVTHNPSLTSYATRVINMLDGQIDTDIKTVADANLPQPISVKIKKKKQQQEGFISIDTDENKKTKKRKKSRRRQ